MADKVTTKITAVDISQLGETPQSKDAVVKFTAAIVVGEKTYTRTIKLLADEEIIWHLGGRIPSAEDIEAEFKAQAQRIQALHDLAVAVESRKGTELNPA